LRKQLGLPPQSAASIRNGNNNGGSGGGGGGGGGDGRRGVKQKVFGLLRIIGATVRDVVGHTDTVGVFCMSFSDFLSHFRSVIVCKVFTDWHCARLDDYFQGGTATTMPSTAATTATTSTKASFPTCCSSSVYQVCVPQSTWTFITLSQQDNRGRGSGGQGRYDDVGVVVLRAQKPPSPTGAAVAASSTSMAATELRYTLADWRFVAAVMPSQRRDAHLEVLMTDAESTYVVIPFSFDARRHARPLAPFALSIFASHALLVNQLSASTLLTYRHAYSAFLAAPQWALLHGVVALGRCEVGSITLASVN
jgi:hypothetical protein